MNVSTKTYALWPSVVRIVATFMIFYFHFGGLTGAYPVAMIDRIAILLFLMISGYFSYKAKRFEWHWLWRRFKNILIPYWPLALCAVGLNYVIGYKVSSAWNDVAVLLGLSLFIDNPIYIISWFITLILCFYLNLFLFRMIRSKVLRIGFLCVSFFVFYKYLQVSGVYYIGFYVGYFLRSRGWLESEPYLKSPVMQVINARLFHIQSHCYVFFLIHGAVVLYHIKSLQWPLPVSFVSALTISLVLSYIYKQFIDRVIAKVNFG